MRRFIATILRFRMWILLVLLMITTGFGYVVTHGVLSTSLVGLFYEEDHPEYVRYLERIQRFGNDEAIIIGLESVEPLATSTITSLRRVHHHLEAMEAVGRVTSLANLSRVTSDVDTVAIKRYADEAFDNPDEIDALMKQVRGDPLVRGLFVSQDAEHMLVIVELEPDPRRAAEEGSRLVTEVLRVFEQEGFAPDRIHRTGMLAITAEIVRLSRDNIIVLFPIVLLLLLLTVYLLFGRLWPVMITSIISLVAVIWTMGFSILLDPNVHILLSIVPGVILIIAFSDVIHLCSAYLIELSEGHEKDEAILRAGVDVGKACLLTSATTGVGFLALTFVPTPVFHHLGIVLGTGVAVALLLAMTLGPILFSLMSRPKPWRVGQTQKVQGFIDGFLEASARLSSRRPGTILFGFAVFVLIAVAGATQLRFENHFEKRLSSTNPVRTAAAFFDANFVGTRTIEVFIETDDAGGLLDPERFHQIVEFRDKLENLDHFERTISIIDLMEATHDAILPEDTEIAFLPTNAQALHQYLVLLEMDGPDALETFLDFQRRAMRLSVYTRETGIR
ncbi:MAG: efflux RND transporter permease subunit, partial [Bradymonadaceae bacterium]